MHSRLKAVRASVWGILLLCALAAPAVILAQQKSALRIGVMVLPPFCMKTSDQKWEGFSIELWKAVAENMGVPSEFREFPNPQPMVNALEKGEIDIIPSLVVADRFESIMDFSQSYMKSGLSIAVPAQRAGYRWARIFQGFFSELILKAIGFMLLMSFLAGLAVWLLERRRNREMFGGSPVEGIGHGIWWAMVTMATVGYGDKAPRTFGGRIVALFWMIFSIVFIANFTAHITTSLTLEELQGKVRGFHDLHNARVGSIKGSEAFAYLSRQGIAVIPFQSFQEGMEAVAGKRIDAFVQDDHVLRHQAKKEFPGQVHVLPGTFNEYFVSIALQGKSPLRKDINKALLEFMKTEKWNELLRRYFG